MGKPEWKSDDRFISNSLRVRNRDLLEGLIEEQTSTKETDEWLEILDGSGMPYAAVNDIQGTLHHEHGIATLYPMDLQHADSVVLARDMVKVVEHPTCGPMKLVNTPVKYSYSEPSIRTPPPILGQHTDEVLKGLLGMSNIEIQSLRKGGVVA